MKDERRKIGNFMDKLWVSWLALMAALAFSPVALAVTPIAKEFLDGNKTKFSTAGHPKAKGVNMSLYYPKSWVAQEGERPNILQKFVGNCGNSQAELQASGRLITSSTVRLGNQQFTKLTTFEDVPKYKIRLTTVQYCINSSYGAVALTGTEEQSMFPRWAGVFEGAATSVRVR